MGTILNSLITKKGTDLEAYGPAHPSVAGSWNNLGSAWYSKGQYDQAIAYYEKALALFTKIIGKNHPHTKIVRNNLNRVRMTTL